MINQPQRRRQQSRTLSILPFLALLLSLSLSLQWLAPCVCLCFSPSQGHSDGATYNINADTMAGDVAGALMADRHCMGRLSRDIQGSVGTHPIILRCAPGYFTEVRGKKPPIFSLKVTERAWLSSSAYLHYPCELVALSRTSASVGLVCPSFSLAHCRSASELPVLHCLVWAFGSLDLHDLSF